MRTFLLSWLFCVLIPGSVPAALPETQELLTKLDAAVLAADLPLCDQLLAEWKQREPKSAAPWLKEVAISQRIAGKPISEMATILTRAVQQLPNNATLRARLAALGELPISHSWLHYRWLLEGEQDPVDRLVWALEMQGLDGYSGKASDAEKWFLYQAKQHPDDLFWQAVLPPPRETLVPLLTAMQEGKLSLNGELVILRYLLAEEAPQIDYTALKIARLLAKAKPHPCFQLLLARYLIYTGHHDEANSILQKTGQLPTLRPAEAETIGTLYLEQCLWDDLCRFLEPKWQGEPENYRYAFLLGCAEEERGRPEVAREIFLKLLHIRQDIVPGHPYCPAICDLDENRPDDSAKFHRMESGSWGRGQYERIRPGNGWDAYSYIRRDHADCGYAQHGLICRYQGNYIVPRTLEEAHQFALCHLASLWSDSAPAVRTQMQAKMESAHIPQVPRLMYELAPGRIEAESGYIYQTQPLFPELVDGQHIHGGCWAWDLEAFHYWKAKDPEKARQFALKLGGAKDQHPIYAAAVKEQLAHGTLPRRRQKQAPRAPETAKIADVEPFPEIAHFTPEPVVTKPSGDPGLPFLPPPWAEEPLPTVDAYMPLQEDSWEAFRRLMVRDFAFGEGLRVLTKPSKDLGRDDRTPILTTQRDFLAAKLDTHPASTPRALGEKAQGYLMLDQDEKAWKVFETALKKRPQDHTLKSIACHLFWHTSLKQRCLTTWGFFPVIYTNRMNEEMIFFPNKMPPNKDARNPPNEMDPGLLRLLVETLEAMPAWQLNYKDYFWMEGLWDTQSLDPEVAALLRRYRTLVLKQPRRTEHAFNEWLKLNPIPGSGPLSEEAVKVAKTYILSRVQYEAVHLLEDANAPQHNALQILRQSARNTQSPAILEQLARELRQQTGEYAQKAADELELIAEIEFCNDSTFPGIAGRILRHHGPLLWPLAQNDRRHLDVTGVLLAELRANYAELALAPHFSLKKLREHLGNEAKKFEPLFTAFHLGEKANRAENLRHHAFLEPWVAAADYPTFREEVILPLRREDRPWAWALLAEYGNAFAVGAYQQAMLDLGWSGPAAGINTFPRPGEPGHSSLGDLLVLLESRSKEEAPPMPARAFGEALEFAARYSKGNAMENFLKVFEQYAEQINQAPEPSRSQIHQLREELLQRL